MNERELMQEGMNLRWHCLLLAKKCWLLLAAAALGAFLFGGGYFLRHVTWGPAKEYAAVSRYYIEFTDDKGKDYYNAYTWNDFMASDPILNVTMSLLPEGIDRELVTAAVKAGIEADVRVLTTTVTTDTPEQSMQIAKAVEQSVIEFGREMKEISSIRVIKPAEVKQVVVDVYTIRAAVLGAVGCFLLVLAYLAFDRALDTAVYLPEDFEKRYRYPVFGTILKQGEQEKNLGELFTNLHYICGDFHELFVMPIGTGREQEIEQLCDKLNAHALSEGKLVPVISSLEEPIAYDRLRGTEGVLLALRFGAPCGALLERTVSQMKKQNCNLVGAIIYNGDEKLLRRYYFPKNIKKNGVK